MFNDCLDVAGKNPLTGKMRGDREAAGEGAYSLGL
jgi:hypothetical protein